MRIGSIVIHCHEFDRLLTFWQNVLHYVPRRPPQGGWVVLCDPEDKGPNLSFQAREKRRPVRNWMHVDLYTDRRDEEVSRLVELGAKRYPWRYRPGADGPGRSRRQPLLRRSVPTRCVAQNGIAP